jgi:hypothetical protein
MAFSELTQPFDGTQPEVSKDEQEQVSALFVSILDDVFLNNIDKIKTTDVILNEVPIPTPSIKLKGDYGGATLSILLTEGMDSVSGYLKAATVQEMHGVYGGDSVKYVLNSDGVVIRIDIPKKTPEQIAIDMASGIRNMGSYALEPEERASMLEKFAELIASRALDSQERKNRELEVTLGLNEQPVGLDEINRLSEILRTAVA